MGKKRGIDLANWNAPPISLSAQTCETKCRNRPIPRKTFGNIIQGIIYFGNVVERIRGPMLAAQHKYGVVPRAPTFSIRASVFWIYWRPMLLKIGLATWLSFCLTDMESKYRTRRWNNGFEKILRLLVPLIWQVTSVVLGDFKVPVPSRMSPAIVAGIRSALMLGSEPWLRLTPPLHMYDGTPR